VRDAGGAPEPLTMTPALPTPRDAWILITREQDTEGDPLNRLGSASCHLRYVPVTRTVEPADPAALRAAARELGSFDWIAVTSGRAVEALDKAGADPRARVRWACVGPATEHALERWLGRKADLVPSTWNAAGLASAILQAGSGSKGGRVLFPAADNAREVLPQTLLRAGMQVDRVVAYRVIPDPPSPERLLPPPGLGFWTTVIFTSGQAVRIFVSTLAGVLSEAGARDLLAGSRPSVLGDSAAAALRESGVEPWHQAPRPTVEDLATSLLTRLAGDGSRGGARSPGRARGSERRPDRS
jgi:uroporphyrinogen III methyltransferase/synthase